MGLIRSGISMVRAIKLPYCIGDSGDYFSAPRMALVEWRAESQLGDMLFQVYVNGCLSGVTIDSAQRRIVVPLPVSLETAVRIEVFAVDLTQADYDFSDELETQPGDSGRVRIVLLRSQTFPVGSTVNIFCDNATGTVDYNNPLNDDPIQFWSVLQEKAGLGMSRFGFSDFGYDSSAAVGFGRGSIGNGEFGLDVDTIEWISPLLPDGIYKFGIVISDSRGNQSSAIETEAVTVTRAAKPAGGLTVSEYDKQAGVLVLKIERQE